MVPGAGGASECVRAEVFDEECGEGVRSGLQDRLVHVLDDLEPVGPGDVLGVRLGHGSGDVP